MNALDLLREDHAYVDQLFKRIEDTPPSRHAAILKRIKNELETHAHIEEKIFYPLLRSKGNKELVAITAEALEEHKQMKKFLGEAVRTTSKEKKEAKLMVLIEDTRHHVREEENEMFPMVRGQFAVEQLDAMGERMEIERASFQKRHRIPSRRASRVKGPVAKLIDKAKDLIGAVADGGGSPKKPGNGDGRKSNGRPAKPAAAAKTAAPKRGSKHSQSK